MTLLKRFLPFVDWIEGYNLQALRADLVAGLTVALVLVPQSMAYAQLAGLPVYYGLYAAFLPPIIASLWGSSRQLATGPVAIVSLMTSAALEPLATAGSEAFVAYALMLALIVGLIQLALGLLRLGLVVNFLSHPVVNGFTNAAALIIATSQLSKIFGVYVDKAPHHYETVLRVFEAALHYTHWPTLGMALLAFAIMILLRRINPRLPNVLVAVVVATLVSWALGFEKDVHVAVEQIQSPGLERLVHNFNESVRDKTELEVLRADGVKGWEHIFSSGEALCLRCHEERQVNRWTRSEESVRTEPFGLALVLHQQAGLLDQRIEALKESISEQRTKLRGLYLHRGRQNENLFYLRDEILPGTEVEPATWFLRVGGSTLDPAALRLSGGGAVIGHIPAGLPALSLPAFDTSVALRLFAAALIISLLGFLEAISIAKAMAARTRQKLDPNQELIGQGLANIVGCAAQSYPVSGSFSRSAVNLQAGARTGLSNVFSGLTVMIVLLFFAGGLYHLPQAVLAAIIMMAVLGLLNVSGFKHAWQTNRFDGAVSVLTFAGTLFFAPHLEWGIFIGVALSLGAYLMRSMRPVVVELVPHPDGSMRDPQRYGLSQCKHLIVFSFEGPLNFVSASHLENELLNRVAELPDLNNILLSGAGISEMDASGEGILRQLIENFRTAGYEVSFAGLSDQVLDTIRSAGLHEVIGSNHLFSTRSQAIAHLFRESHFGAEDEDCPYLQGVPPLVEVSLHRDGSLRNIDRHELPTCRHIAILRIDGPLSFANTNLLEPEVESILFKRPHVRKVLFAMHSLSALDISGAENLGRLVKTLRHKGYAVCFSGLMEPIQDVLEDAGMMHIIGPENNYPTQQSAVAAIYAKAHTGSSEKNCPLLALAPRLIELSLHPDGSLRDAQSRHLEVCPRIGVLRFQGPAFSSRKPMRSVFIGWAKQRPQVSGVLFSAHSVNDLRHEEADNLHAFVREVREAGYRVVLSDFADPVFDVLATSGNADAIGLDAIYPTAALALAAIYAESHETPCRDATCPLTEMLPRITNLSLHEDGSLRDVHRHHLALCRHIAAVRFDGSLNFATMEYFRELLVADLAERPEVRSLLIAGHTIDRLDPVGAEELVRLVRDFRGRGFAVSFSGLNDYVLDMLHRMGGFEKIGADSIFATQARAVLGIHEAAHAGSDESPCPLIQVVRQELPSPA